jgi:hypothetical protein
MLIAIDGEYALLPHSWLSWRIWIYMDIYIYVCIYDIYGRSINVGYKQTSGTGGAPLCT